MGTPLVALMLERAAQAIQEVILPNLTDAFALEEASHIAMMLLSVAPTIEEKCQELREENEGMREVLGKVLEALRGEKSLSRNEVTNGLMERLEHELEKADVEPPDVSQENHDLKGALVETIKGLDALTEDFPVEKMSSLRQQVRSVLRQQMNYAVARREAGMAARMESVMALFQPQSSPEV